jgi:hypothetical protein
VHLSKAGDPIHQCDVIQSLVDEIGLSPTKFDIQSTILSLLCNVHVNW